MTFDSLESAPLIGQNSQSTCPASRPLVQSTLTVW